MRYTVVLEWEPDGGYVAGVPAFPGCISQGDTRSEALANIREAIELYLADCRDAGDPIPSEQGKSSWRSRRRRPRWRTFPPVCPAARFGELPPLRHPGEGRDPRPEWVPACAGMVEWAVERDTAAGARLSSATLILVRPTWSAASAASGVNRCAGRR